MSGGPPPPQPPPPAAAVPQFTPAAAPSGPTGSKSGSNFKVPQGFGGPIANSLQAGLAGSINPIFGATILGSGAGASSLGGK